VLLRLFPSQYVALSRLTFKALPFGRQKAGDCISPPEKNVADLLAWAELLSGCERSLVVRAARHHKGTSL